MITGLITVIFFIAIAGAFLLGIKIGEEKMRGQQANNERRDEDEWKEIDKD